MMNSIVRNGVTAVAVAWLAAGVYPGARQAQGVMAQARPQAAGNAGATGLDVVQLRPNFYMIAGAGGNIAVQIGQDGVVVVDAGSGDNADAVVAAINRLSERPIRYVINTSADADHVGGNVTVSKAGQTLLTMTGAGAGGSVAAFNGLTNGGAAAILAADEVLARMSAPTGKASAFPSAAWPTESFGQAQRALFLNDEGIQVLHQPAAHSDGDSIVFFRRSDVIVAGDILDTTRFPVIDVARGGSIQGELDALNRLIDLAIASIPIVSRDGGTYVVPGHGRVFDHFDLVDYRDMITIIRDRVRDLAKGGKTLAQVKTASPARGYTRQYGATSGPWTTDMFIEAIYKSLPLEKKP
jgi:glyoxylase-like metal-dependent hydrolase (beta-lactamase superfamily II)